MARKVWQRIPKVTQQRDFRYHCCFLRSSVPHPMILFSIQMHSKFYGHSSPDINREVVLFPSNNSHRKCACPTRTRSPLGFDCSRLPWFLLLPSSFSLVLLASQECFKRQWNSNSHSRIGMKLCGELDTEEWMGFPVWRNEIPFSVSSRSEKNAAPPFTLP